MFAPPSRAPDARRGVMTDRAVRNVPALCCAHGGSFGSAFGVVRVEGAGRLRWLRLAATSISDGSDHYTTQREGAGWKSAAGIAIAVRRVELNTAGVARKKASL